MIKEKLKDTQQFNSLNEKDVDFEEQRRRRRGKNENMVETWVITRMNRHVIKGEQLRIDQIRRRLITSAGDDVQTRRLSLPTNVLL